MFALTDEWNPKVKTFEIFDQSVHDTIVSIKGMPQALPPFCPFHRWFVGIQWHVLPFFPTKSMVGPWSQPSESTAEEVSFEW